MYCYWTLKFSIQLLLLLLIIRLENIVYLLVFIYKYNIRETQVSLSIALSRGFSDKILTEVEIEELYHKRLSTCRVLTKYNIIIENKL